MKPPGYENLARQRPPAFETNDWTGTGDPAESRGRGLAFGRPRGSGHTTPAARTVTPQRPSAGPADAELQQLQMRTRLLELELGA